MIEKEKELKIVDDLITKGQELKETFTVESNMIYKKSTKNDEVYQWATRCLRFINGVDGRKDNSIYQKFEKIYVSNINAIENNEFDVLFGIIKGMKDSINELDEDEDF